MKIYILKDGHVYSPNGLNLFVTSTLDIQTAFEVYAGKVTMMITWEVEGHEGLHSVHVIPSAADKKALA